MYGFNISLFEGLVLFQGLIVDGRKRHFLYQAGVVMSLYLVFFAHAYQF